MTTAARLKDVLVIHIKPNVTSDEAMYNVKPYTEANEFIPYPTVAVLSTIDSEKFRMVDLITNRFDVEIVHEEKSTLTLSVVVAPLF